MADPATGSWTVDPTTSSIGFRANLILGLKVKGRFAEYESTITVGETVEESVIEVTVHTASVATGITLRDKHLRADDVFASERFPTVEFHSTAISATSAGVDVTGTLRVRDVTTPASFQARASTEPGPPRYTAELTVNPKDFGITRPGTTKPVTVVLDATLRPA